MTESSKNDVLFKSSYPFVAFPSWIFTRQLQEPDWLSCKEITLILALQSFADGMQGANDVYPSVERLAKMTALSKRTVIDAIKSLQEKGLIEKATRYKDGERKTNIYTLKIWNHACPLQKNAVSPVSQQASELSAESALTPDPKCKKRQTLGAEFAPKLEPLNKNQINPPISPHPSRPAAQDAAQIQKRSERHPEAPTSAQKPLELPAYAEPFREPLEAWLKASRKKHRNKGTSLTPHDLRGLKAAHDLQVLKEFCEFAAKSTWMSLGFSGHVEFLQKLQRDSQFHAKTKKSSVRELTDEDFC